ncbi:hypothetical protein ACLB2K_037114 [Fragaria x ananassa]
MNMIAELVLTVVCYSNSTDTTCELKPCQGMFLDMVMDLMLMDMEQEPSELNEEDLRVLVSHIEETDGGPPWKLMMEQSIPSLTYKAWYRNPPIGPPQYRTRTVFENVSPEILRDFFWDDEFRPRWDKMLIHSKVLSICLQTATTLLQCSRIYHNPSHLGVCNRILLCNKGNTISISTKAKKTETSRCVSFKLVYKASEIQECWSANRIRSASVSL